MRWIATTKTVLPWQQQITAIHHRTVQQHLLHLILQWTAAELNSSGQHQLSPMFEQNSSTESAAAESSNNRELP
ncbi:hypothetical protein RHGRI_007752 [Rhododendron griersonianum]|uniref:Uncharacterized protein n=1 Tax=Rhododendron griersonianum TaxID=479676 RepID=A0AAV6KY24_9ERIC|nr:hypothetical protein RHGRI_007752 [Rhododendron griersonianum]